MKNKQLQKYKRTSMNIFRTKYRRIISSSHYIKRDKIPKINNGLLIKEDLKDFYSFEKIKKKIDKSVRIEESELAILKEFIDKTGYFRFSIYLKLMKDIEGVTVIDIIKTCQLDGYIRDNLFSFTTRLEMFWKKTIVDTMCLNYETNDFFHNSQCYLDKKIYKNDEWGNLIIQEFNKSFFSNNSPAFKHHKNKKKNCIPIWALFEGLTFGQINTFITQLDARYYNAWVSSIYNNPAYKKAMKSWITVIRTSRNRSAHNSRIYGLKATDVPMILKKTSRNYFSDNKSKNIDSTLLFGTLYVIKHLFMYENDHIKENWNNFIYKLNDKLLEIKKIEKSQYGFSEDWVKQLEIID